MSRVAGLARAMGVARARRRVSRDAGINARRSQSVELLCDAYTQYRAARKVVQDLGATYTTIAQTGTELIRQRPEVNIAAEAWRRASLMLQQFGLTPSSRAKIEAAEDGGGEDLEGFLNRGKR